jgi:quinoprotein dehydrogenase-associated probable ABC transporter substrate-binding protein
LINPFKIVFLSFFCLFIIFKNSYSAQEVTGEIGVRSSLRICADPSNLPYSNQKEEGYENKIANLLAKKLGNIPVYYTWYPMTHGFVRRTLRAKLCDLIITFPAVHEFVQNSNPFYTSSYVLMTLEKKKITVETLSDPIIKDKKYKIGIIHATPPSSSVAKYGLFKQVKFYKQAADTRHEKPWAVITEDLRKGDIDIGVIWGPYAGYEAKISKLPIKLIPLIKEEKISRGKMVYRFTMGIRKNEPEWEKTINNLIKENQEEINQILREYGIPLLDNLGKPLK